MWDRWKEGESLHSIARLFDRGHASVARILGETGGGSLEIFFINLWLGFTVAMKWPAEPWTPI